MLGIFVLSTLVLTGVAIGVMDDDTEGGSGVLGDGETRDDAGLEPSRPDQPNTDITSLDDLLAFGSGDDVIESASGDDTVYAGGGDDSVNGGAGLDEIFGEGGDDTLFGGQYHDTLSGGLGDDTLRGGPGQDVLEGDEGDDRLNGDGYHDILFGGEGDDELLGGDGRDYLLGEDGDDELFGEAWNDTLLGGDGDDTLIGGEGNDVLWGGQFDHTPTAEEIAAFRDEDIRFDAELSDDPTNGNDVLEGGAGNDLLLLEAGDTGTGGDGNDQFDIRLDPRSDDLITIQDFNANDDIVEIFADDGLSSTSEVLEILDDDATGDAWLLRDGEAVVRLVGASGQLTASNFAIHTS